MKKVGIIGVGSYLPSKVLTNSDLEKIVDTTDEWITTRTGIKERRLAAKNEATSDLAARAAQEALKNARLQPEKVELIIVATVTPDMQFPSTACLIQKALHAPHAACFDLSAACAGFVYGLEMARHSIASGAYRNALVCGAEVMSSITDWKDRSTCVLFGDGAGACVLGTVASGGIMATHLGSDGSMSELLMVPAGGSRMPSSHQTVEEGLHYVKMRGNELFKVAVNAMAKAAHEAVIKAGIKCEDIDLVIPHQANVRIITAVAKKLGLPEDRIFLNIERYGNMSAASTAVALCEAVKEGRVKRGDIVLLDAFGAGLVWGACVIKW